MINEGLTEIREGLADIERILAINSCYRITPKELTILTLTTKGKLALNLLAINYTETDGCLVLQKAEYIRLVKLAEDY